MTQFKIPHGVWTAIVTPFLQDQEIDWASYDSLVKRQQQAKIDGLVLCGTTGEASTLTIQEKLTLIKKTKVLTQGSMPIMAGVGSSSTTQTIELAKLAVDAGADSLLVVTPPYTKPSISGLFQHYEQIAKSVRVPICLYHVPSRTAQSLSAEQIAKICSIENVAMVKEASGNLVLFAQALRQSNAHFVSGDDFTFLPSLAIGGCGVISVISNLYPEAMVALWQATKNNDYSRAAEIHHILLPMLDALFCETSPGPLKAALFFQHRCENILRLPLAAVENSATNKILEAIHITDKKFNDIGVHQ